MMPNSATRLQRSDTTRLTLAGSIRMTPAGAPKQLIRLPAPAGLAVGRGRLLSRRCLVAATLNKAEPDALPARPKGACPAHAENLEDQERFGDRASLSSRGDAVKLDPNTICPINAARAQVQARSIS